VKFCLKNILNAVGSYWLSTWAAAPLGALIQKFNNGVIYGDSILAAILLGVVLSLGRALAAAAAGICVTLVADGKKSEFWAIIPAALYATRLFRNNWQVPPTMWDHVMISVDRFFPAIVCVTVAFLVARFRRVRTTP